VDARPTLPDEIGVGLDGPDAAAFVGWPCPLCGSAASRPVCRTRDYNWGLPGRFTYVACRDCGLVRQDPRPPDASLPGLYPRHYGAAVPEATDEPAVKIEAPVHRHRARLIERYRRPPGSIFDIGCGSGFFLRFMRDRGWKAGGLEAAAEHVAYARDALGLTGVSRGSWPVASGADAGADVVCLFHVIEHLPDPIEALRRTRSLLRPAGILVVETPNVDGWPVRVFGSYCTVFDAPRHLCLFSRPTLARTTEAAGFRVLGLETFSPSTLEYTESLRYALQGLRLRRYPPKAPGETPGPAPTRRAEAPVAESRALRLVHRGERLAARTVNAVARIAGQGCNLLMVARPA
jgi:2-polyprenyl-3-methyl-5-hydroxy-6-metoxy-1,4-benzoquinol methylase